MAPLTASLLQVSFIGLFVPLGRALVGLLLFALVVYAVAKLIWRASTGAVLTDPAAAQPARTTSDP